VAQVLEGDVEAYRLIVERHQVRIFYLGLKFLRRPEDAEDFAQEVFLRAFAKLASFQGSVPFSAWLYRIAFNLAVNRYHLKKRAFLEVHTAELQPDPGISPEQKVLREELADWVRKALARIPETYHLLIKMHFFDGLSYPEISKVLQMPVNTIKSYIFRAKELIRQMLQGREREIING
jgi:RNA polymerase sigma-70 factor (ECF subfamily)